MPTKVIIDTDPGVDDTMAICMALRSPELEVIGLTTIFGNSSTTNTTQNALRLVELEGNDHIPVAKGCDVPLVAAPGKHAAHVHGLDGMGNTNLPEPRGKAVDQPAAQFIIEQVLAHPHEITLLPVGPLTNIALACRLEPRIIDLVKEVVIMGGAANVPGNISPLAEANIYNDAHAAQIVFGAGWKLTMVGLDVTTKVIQTREHLDAICHANNPAGKLIGRILPCYQNYFDQRFSMNGSICTHDPSAVAYVINPKLFRTESHPTYVETEGHCRGKVVPDYGHHWEGLKPVNLCLDVDSAGVISLIRERLTK